MGAAPSRNHESKVIWMMGDDGDLSTPSQNMVSCYVRGNEPVVKNMEERWSTVSHWPPSRGVWDCCATKRRPLAHCAEAASLLH